MTVEVVAPPDFVALTVSVLRDGLRAAGLRDTVGHHRPAGSGEGVQVVTATPRRIRPGLWAADLSLFVWSESFDYAAAVAALLDGEPAEGVTHSSVTDGPTEFPDPDANLERWILNLRMVAHGRRL